MTKKNFLGNPLFGFLGKQPGDTVCPGIRSRSLVCGKQSRLLKSSLISTPCFFIYKSQRASKHSLRLTAPPCQPRITVPILQMGRLIERAIKWLSHEAPIEQTRCCSKKESDASRRWGTCGQGWRLPVVSPC